MGHVEFSLDVLNKTGTNILEPGHYSYKTLKDKLGRPPKLEEFSNWDRSSHQDFLTASELQQKLQDPQAVVHIRFNHGARAGSIARVVNPAAIYRSPTTPGYYSRSGIYVDSECKLEVMWDDGKTWSFKLYRHLDSNVIKNYGGKHHDFLFGYDGPTTKAFEKKERVVLPAAENPDAYGRIIRVDDWVMDRRFRIGQVNRISDKGTMWIKFIQQSLGDGRHSKTYVEQFGRSSTEILILELPEGFETTAAIMDNDITDFVITPTFRFGYAADD